MRNLSLDEIVTSAIEVTYGGAAATAAVDEAMEEMEAMEDNDEARFFLSHAPTISTPIRVSYFRGLEINTWSVRTLLH